MNKMTKSNYVAIEEIIRIEKINGYHLPYLERLCFKLAKYFETENVKFDRKKFIDSCGVRK